MSEPTADEIARWAALAEAATPGPWETRVWAMPGATVDEWFIREIVRPNPGFHPLNVLKVRGAAHPSRECCWPPAEADAEFIAAARDAVPRLLALVAAQAEQIAAVTADRDQADYVLRATGDKLEAIREQRDAARAELHALHATDDYQRWARAVVERDAAREAVSELRARVEAEIESWHHTVVDDCWYTCPAATEEREGETCCNHDAGNACDCGLDFRKAKIHAALYPEPPQ